MTFILLVHVGQDPLYKVSFEVCGFSFFEYCKVISMPSSSVVSH